MYPLYPPVPPPMDDFHTCKPPAGDDTELVPGTGFCSLELASFGGSLTAGWVTELMDSNGSLLAELELVSAALTYSCDL